MAVVGSWQDRWLKKGAWKIIILLGSVIAFAVATYLHVEEEKNHFPNALCDLANSQARATSNINFRLSSLTNFRWDKLYIFSPYTSENEIDRQLGLDWRGANAKEIERQESFYLLVFRKGGKVVRDFMFSRHCCDFAEKQIKNPIAREKDEFKFLVSDSQKVVICPEKN